MLYIGHSAAGCTICSLHRLCLTSYSSSSDYLLEVSIATMTWPLSTLIQLSTSVIYSRDSHGLIRTSTITWETLGDIWLNFGTHWIKTALEISFSCMNRRCHDTIRSRGGGTQYQHKEAPYKFMFLSKIKIHNYVYFFCCFTFNLRDEFKNRRRYLEVNLIE